MGLDVYLYDGKESLHKWAHEGETPLKSAKYPDHYCTPAYLRSSYNDGGFNSVVGKLIGKDLYWVFEPIDDEAQYEAASAEEQEDWNGPSYSKAHLQAALKRARQLTNELKAAPAVGVMTPSTYRASTLTAEEAVQRYVKHAAKRAANPGPFGNSYGSAEGDFFLDEPLEVLAVIPGVDVFGEAGYHLVYKNDLTWYDQAAEIVEEFLELALTLDDPRITWSS